MTAPAARDKVAGVILLQFDLAALRTYLRVPALNIRCVPVTGSTNADLLADTGAEPGDVLIAEAQTAGRGRMNRAFASPEGGLYMSVLLRPDNPDDALLITPRAAVAVAGAIEAVSGRKAAIKWVNDIQLGGKKVCGILAEARAGETMKVALGIGVNISSVPEGLESIAGRIFESAPSFARERLAAEILNRLFSPAQDVYDEYLRRCTTVGRKVTVRSGNETYPAFAEGIDRRFRLTVRLPDGSVRVLDSGEVSTSV